MAGTTYKLGADVDGFNKGLKEAQESVKTLDKELELNEKRMEILYREINSAFLS